MSPRHEDAPQFGAVETAPVLRQAPELGQVRVEMVNFDAWPAELVLALHRNTRVGGYVFGVSAVLTGTIDAVVIAGDEMGYFSKPFKAAVRGSVGAPAAVPQHVAPDVRSPRP